MKRIIYPVMSIVTLVLFVSTVVILAQGVKNNNDEILKSRIINLEGRSQVIAEIDRRCK